MVDLHLLAMRYTLRVVGRTLFGDDVERLVPVLDALVPEVGDAIRRRGLQVVQLPMRWPTLRNRRPRRLHRRLQEVVQDVLAGSGCSGVGDGRDDLVGRLHDATDPDGAARLTAQEVRDQALVFLLAGHETTAAALTSTLHLLGCHPGAQAEVAAELDEVLGCRTAPDPVDVERLVVTRAALMEGMRLYPPAYAVDRTTTAPLRLAGHDVPAGTVLAVSPWSTHRHPDSGPTPSGSTRPASSVSTTGRATRGSRSVEARAAASASTSPCSRPRSCSAPCSTGSASRPCPARCTSSPA